MLPYVNLLRHGQRFRFLFKAWPLAQCFFSFFLGGKGLKMFEGQSVKMVCLRLQADANLMKATAIGQLYEESIIIVSIDAGVAF